VIIIVALFKKKNDIFFKAMKAADNIPGDLPKLSRGEITSFQRLKNDSAWQPATHHMESRIKRSLTVLMPWACDRHVVSPSRGTSK